MVFNQFDHFFVFIHRTDMQWIISNRNHTNRAPTAVWRKSSRRGSEIANLPTRVTTMIIQHSIETQTLFKRPHGCPSISILRTLSIFDCTNSAEGAGSLFNTLLFSPLLLCRLSVYRDTFFLVWTSICGQRRDGVCVCMKLTKVFGSMKDIGWRLNS